MKTLKTRTSMRDIMALAQDLSVDKVSGFNFRSPDEVQTLIDQMSEQLKSTETRLKKLERLFPAAKATAAEEFVITFNRGAKPAGKTVRNQDGDRIEPVDIKNIKQLQSNFDIIKDLDKRLQVIDSLEVQYQEAFGNERNRIGPSLKELRRKYESQLKKALAVLRKIAKAHEPPELSEMIQEVMNSFYSQLKDKFDAAEQYVYVTTKKTDIPGSDGTILVFNHYIEFTGLRNDSQDFTYPKYFMVFSATINSKGLMRTFIQTLHKFKSPGTFKLGSQFNSVKQGISRLAGLLAADDFVDVLERSRVPEDSLDVKHFAAREVIEDVKVTDDQVIKITLTKAVTDKNKDLVAKKVLEDIHRLLSGKTGGKIKYRAPKRNRADQYTLEFVVVLPPEADPEALTPQQLDSLREDFGFDDDDLKAIRSIRQRGH